MTLYEKLKENKGLLSSSLSKKFAKEVLTGNQNILAESLKLIHNNDKNIRSGAAKIIEIVAEEKPFLVSNHLNDLLPCLNYDEKQTRWMVLHIAGLSANLNPVISRKAFDYAIKYLDKKYGTVLNDRSITYLGYIGSISNDDCKKSFPYLINSFKLHPNRVTRVFESLNRMINHMDKNQKKILLEYINEYLHSNKPTIKKWAAKLNNNIK